MTETEFTSVASTGWASGPYIDPDAKPAPVKRPSPLQRLRMRTVDALRQMIEALGEDAGRWS